MGVTGVPGVLQKWVDMSRVMFPRLLGRKRSTCLHGGDRQSRLLWFFFPFFSKFLEDPVIREISITRELAFSSPRITSSKPIANTIPSSARKTQPQTKAPTKPSPRAANAPGAASPKPTTPVTAAWATPSPSTASTTKPSKSLSPPFPSPRA